MDLTIAGSGFSFTPNDDELGGISLELSAFDGEVGIGQFPVPDPGSSILPVTGRQFKVVQDFTVLCDGYMLDWDRQRGPFINSTEREYPISVQDPNALLAGFRVVQSRGSETDYARVAAFAAAYGSTLGVAWDTTWVLNSSTVTMPAKKYDTDGGFTELITDVVEFTGKTLFLHDKAGGGRCLHYHLLTAGHTCGLSISDVLGDYNGVTVFYPDKGNIHQRTSVDLVNSVKGRDQAGRTSTQSDATSISDHDADGLPHEALIEFDASSQADLNVKTAAYLASRKADYDVYRCTIGPLDGTALGRIRVGDIITVTSKAMGLVAAEKRIAHMILRVYGGNASGLWTAELEMGAPIRRRARVNLAPRLAALVRPYINVPRDPTPVPIFSPVCAASLLWSAGAATGDGSMVGDGELGRDNAILSTGASGGSQAASLTGSPWALDEASGSLTFAIHLDNGVMVDGSSLFDGLITHVTLLTDTGDGIDASIFGSGGPPLDGTFGVYIWVGPDSVTNFVTDRVAMVQDFDVLITWSPGFGSVTCGGLTISAALSGSPDSLAVFSGNINGDTATVFTVDVATACIVTGVPAPGAGVEVVEVIGTGDGVTTAFTTTAAYMPLSISAYANDLPEFEFTETDATTITFASPPFDGEVIRVRYRAA